VAAGRENGEAVGFFQTQIEVESGANSGLTGGNFRRQLR